MNRAGRVAALILAAGRSSRMGSNKLLLPLADGASLIEHVVDRVGAAAADPVVVVIGHEAHRIRAVLAGRDLRLVENRDYANGLSTSLQAGLRALPGDVAGCVVCLGDMPSIGAGLLRRMMAAFAAAWDDCIVVPVRHGRRGNPVLWSRCFFPELMALSGDVGGRALLDRHPDRIVEVAAEDDGVLIDLDTPEALARFLGGAALA